MPDRIGETLAALAAPAEGLRPDWHEVTRRARRAHRRTVALLAVAGAVVLASTALAVVPALLKPKALAFMRSVTIPDAGAPPAVRDAFAEHRFAGKPRKALELRSRRGPLVLWVSPLRGHGWCSSLQRPAAPLFVQCTWWKGAYGPFAGGYVGPVLFVGRAAVTPGRQLRLRFRDGSSVRVPTRDGFYLYRAPDRLLVRAAPRALVLRDAERVLARMRLGVLYDSPVFFGGIRRPPGGADTKHARRIVAARTKTGPALVMGARSNLRPADCWWLEIRRATYGGACARTDRNQSSIWSVAPVRLRIRGHEVWALWGRAGTRYKTLGLRFQDGAKAALTPRGGYFLYLVPGERRKQGRRPAVLVARDARGREVKKELLFTFTWAP